MIIHAVLDLIKQSLVCCLWMSIIIMKGKDSYINGSLHVRSIWHLHTAKKNCWVNCMSIMHVKNVWVALHSISHGGSSKVCIVHFILCCWSIVTSYREVNKTKLVTPDYELMGLTLYQGLFVKIINGCGQFFWLVVCWLLSEELS